VRRWILAGLILLVLGVRFLWLPAEEAEVEAVAEAVDPATTAAPRAVHLFAEPGAATPTYVETWDLSFPHEGAVAQRLTLAIGKAAAANAPIPARLTAAPDGDASGLLAQSGDVLGAGADAAPSLQPPAPALDLQLVFLGNRLSIGEGAAGATVVAGVFNSAPAGDWHVYRVAFGSGGPQCFLGISPSTERAMLLMRDPADGPAIQARLRALLQPRPAAS
jgi:hypothetical protein